MVDFLSDPCRQLIHRAGGQGAAGEQPERLRDGGTMPGAFLEREMLQAPNS